MASSGERTHLRGSTNGSWRTEYGVEIDGDTLDDFYPQFKNAVRTVRGLPGAYFPRKRRAVVSPQVREASEKLTRRDALRMSVRRPYSSARRCVSTSWCARRAPRRRLPPLPSPPRCANANEEAVGVAFPDDDDDWSDIALLESVPDASTQRLARQMRRERERARRQAAKAVDASPEVGSAMAKESSTKVRRSRLLYSMPLQSSQP